jgi:NAD dependent epimerase/dehydratase family enzyme
VVLKSRWAVPQKLLDAGFRFRWTRLPEAVQQLLR